VVKMAKPLYIICAETVVLDRHTNRVSAVNLIENVPISRHDEETPESTKKRKPLSFDILTAWAREDDDSVENTYESEIVAFFPNAPHADGVILGRFPELTFKGYVTRTFTRDVLFEGCWGPGLLLIEARFRRRGATEWTVGQTYLVLEHGRSNQVAN
jgi:hypothetical protein